MDNNKKNTFDIFIKKAAQRIEDKKVGKKQKLYVPSLDAEITIRSLTKAEFLEINTVDETAVSDEADRYALYLSVIEPNLKEVAVELKNQGKIVEYTDVCDIFETWERTDIVKKIMEISGLMSKDSIKVVVDELKN